MIKGHGTQRVFRGDSLKEIAFPLGGIGTGTISLGGRGNLRDFEIFGKPNKGRVLPFTFFSLWAKQEGGEPVAKVLEGQIPPPYRNGFGEPQDQLQGLPRFADAVFEGRYPMASLELSDPKVPVKARLTAWNPFIPQNVFDSALPIGIFEWTFENNADKPVDISLCASMKNPCAASNGKGGHDASGSINEYRHVQALRGIFMCHPKADAGDSRTTTLALATPWESGTVQTRWYRGGWWDSCHLFWDDWCQDGDLRPVTDAEPSPHGGDVASLVMKAHIEPGKSVTIPVFISWHYSLIQNPWPGDPENDPKVLPTYMGAKFDNAWEVARYAAGSFDRLRGDTERWLDAMFLSTLPPIVIDAVTSQASIMRTPTCFLLADGSFFGWEGCGNDAGCCHGNCTHVWNYEQAVAFLFPELERSMRRTDFIYDTTETGRMHFRINLPLGTKRWHMKPCADGQMGSIIQLYRDWQLSGDDGFLREMWPKAQAALEYAWTMRPDHPAKEDIDCIWDLDRDGVIEGEQHNTYDIEFFGPNTMCTAMYLGALKAAELMARHLGYESKAEEYKVIREKGAAKVDKTLFNGDYYIQQVKVIDEVNVPEHLKSPEYLRSSGEADETGGGCGPECACKKSPDGKAPSLAKGETVPKYQYGEGCLSDQLLGQWACHVAGLGHILDSDHVKSAMKSIYDNNFITSFADFSNVQRVYGLNDEAGLLLCTWPRGNRPLLPFVYSDEVWTGIEYHVAAHLIYEGFVEQGLNIVKAVRGRYAGYNRNPWNEVECGYHYARAMSSWSVKLALDGFNYSVPAKSIGFAPKTAEALYKTFWSVGTGWGTYTQDSGARTFKLSVEKGYLELNELTLSLLKGDEAGHQEEIELEGPEGVIRGKKDGGKLILSETVCLNAGQSLSIC